MVESPDRAAILQDYFGKSSDNKYGMSRKNAAKAARSYSRVRRKILTPCAQVRGARPYNMGGKVLFNATRGSRSQVMNGTAHHSCSGLKKGDYTRNPKTGRIVSVKKRAAGLRRWKMMDPETKAKWMANAGRGFGPKLRRSKRGVTRVNYKGMA